MKFEKAKKIYPHDRLLARTLLRLVPQSLTPNFFTIIRFILTPVVFYFIFTKAYIIGLVIFLIASFTDTIDGSLARTRNQITQWGKIYDPVADKFLIVGVILILMTKYLNPMMSYLILLVEIIISISAGIRKHLGHDVQANWWGKWKMIFMVIGIGILLLGIILGNGPVILLAQYVMILAIGLGIMSAITLSI